MVIIVELTGMTCQSVPLETREPHDLFLVAATTAVTGLEIAVQLNEIQARMFGRIPIRNRAVRTKKLIGNLKIIAAGDEPIGLEQAFDPNKGNRSGEPELKA